MASLDAWMWLMFVNIFLVRDVTYIRDLPILDHRLEPYWRGCTYRPHLSTISAVLL